MANWEVIFTNGITYAAGSTDLLNPEVTAIFEQDVVSYEYTEWLLDKLGFTSTRPLNPNEKFSIEIGAYELDEMTEGQLIPEVDVGKGRDKGYKAVPFGGKISLSRIMKEWLGTTQTLKDADSSVQTTFRKFKSDVQRLRRGSMKSMNTYATRIYTDGYSNTAANWPGSLTPYGQFLWDTDQPYGQGAGAGTFRNVLGGSYGTLNSAFSTTNLQYMLDMHKAELRLQNGDRVDSPSSYKLLTSRVNAVTVREVLNTAGNSAGVYSGAANNSAELNTFNFNGNKVEIVEVPDLGRTKKDGSVVGADTHYYLVNTDAARQAMALRVLPIIRNEVDMWYEENTKTTYVSLYDYYAMDHYGFESFATASQGTA